MADYYDGRVRVRFRPPSLIEIVTLDGNSFAYYAVPVKSGIVHTIGVSASANKPPFRFPRWVDHWRRNELVEGDLKLMMSQEEEMRTTSASLTCQDYPSSWSKFHMPTGSDRLIVEMRRWIAEHAPDENCEWYQFPTVVESGRSNLTSRFLSHTDSCPSCSVVHKRARRARDVMQYLGVILAVLSSIPNDKRWRLLAVVSALLLFVLRALCAQIVARIE